MWTFRRVSKAKRRPEVVRRFADLQAMTPAEQTAALAATDADGWIRAAACRGLVEAQVLLGQLYLEGRARPAGAGMAYRWFSAAAVSGYPPGLNMKGRCLENGWDTAPDPAAAAECYATAAQAGLDWAQYNLANLLLGGTGVPRDRTEACRWYECAAAQGHAKAMNMLGRFYEEGWDRPSQPQLAEAWYRRSAEGGDYRGQFNLGSLLAQQGRQEEAVRWIEISIKQGSPGFLRDAGAMLATSEDSGLLALAAQARARCDMLIKAQ